MCRSLSIRTISFERSDLWPTYLACCYILSLSRSCSTVKVIRKSSRSHDEITAPTTVASAVHTVNVYTGSGLWRTTLNYGRNVHWLSAVLKWSVRHRVRLFQFTLWTGSFANTVRLLVRCMLWYCLLPALRRPTAWCYQVWATRHQLRRHRFQSVIRRPVPAHAQVPRSPVSLRDR